jgi:NACalpha-BTF3-like transcription factor
MANYYGVNVADNEYGAASSTSSSTGKDVEIVVNTTNITSRQQIVNALEKLTNFIIRSNWPL